MGISSNYLIEVMEEKYFDAKEKWIREHLGEDADEDTPGWDELSDEFDEGYSYEDYEYDDWSVPGKSRIEIYNETISSVQEILNNNYSPSTTRNILVMLHGHVVSAIEGYLSKTFIDATLLSDEKIRLLVENDPEFAKRTFTVKEIFSKKDALKEDVSLYLRNLIFHKVNKIKPMYKSVFGIDFGNIDWLVKAVALRHHCVHRAGYDKEGNEVNLSPEEINSLINRCSTLVENIESKIIEYENGLPY